MKRFQKINRLKRHLLAAVLITFAVFQTPAFLVNNPKFQQWFLNTYRPFSPWQVQVGSLKLKPWLFRVDIANLNLYHPQGHRLSFEEIHASLNPLRLFRGQLGVRSLEVKSPTLVLSKSLVSEKKGPKKPFKIRTLILLQNLVISKGILENVEIDFPGKDRFKVAEVGLKLKPSIRRGTRLSLDFKDVYMEQQFAPPLSVEKIGVRVATNFNHWSKSFPYIDDLDGNLRMDNITRGKLFVSKLETYLRLDKTKIKSKKFLIQTEEGEILGNLDTDFGTEKFSFQIETPKGVRIPELGDEKRTFNTAGSLNATVKLEGEGFDPKTSHGKGSVTARHLFENFEDHPAEADIQFDWQNGKAMLKTATVTTDDAAVNAKGTIDLSPFSFNLDLDTDNFPLERFFEKFEDDNLHPIHGRGQAKGTLKGIGNTIHLHLNGEAADGGYGPVLAQKAAVVLDLTHPKLELDGTVWTDGKETGKALLLIQYGEKKPGDKSRPKKITLDAKFENHPIESSLPYGFSGLLGAQLKLSGAPETIQGDCHFIASAGKIFGEGFETIDGHFKLNSKKLTLDKADFIFSETSAHFIRPLVMDFKPGEFKIAGQPLETLQMDVDYFSKTKAWRINKLVIGDSENQELKSQISGKISPEGLDLKGSGDLDLASLKILSQFIRDASGPAHFQLAVHGKVPNVQINGRIEFEGNTLFPRIYSYAAENLEGILLFEGNKIRTEKLTGDIESGSFETKGWLSHSGGAISAYDLNFTGRQISYRNKKWNFRAEFDTDLKMKGNAQNPELSGTIVILDGRYNKDFNLIEEFKKAPTAAREIKEAALTEQPLKLDLKIKNLGDLIIDNNVGKIELAANVTVKGTDKLPHVEGVINTTEGQIHYLGFDFDITRGFIEFRDQYKAPYLEVDGEQEIGDAQILIKLLGNTDNLAVDLSGTSAQEGGLDKKDALSLLLFGTTEGSGQTDLIQQERSPDIIAERFASVLQRPLARVAHLDVFSLESTPDQNGEDRVRRLNIGKRLSDRLTVELASELRQDATVQSFQLEYWLTDFFILKGAQSTDESYQMGAGVKFKGR